MNYKLLIFIFFFTLNCTLNKVSNTHGFRFLDTKFDSIVVNKTNKNDVRKFIGPPSSISKFGDVRFYIERKKTNQKLFKLGKKKISKNNILILSFNNKGIIIEKDLLDLNKMNDIKIAETKTNKKFEQKNFVYNLISTLREKMNAPTRKKK